MAKYGKVANPVGAVKAPAAAKLGRPSYGQNNHVPQAPAPKLGLPTYGQNNHVPEYTAPATAPGPGDHNTPASQSDHPVVHQEQASAAPFTP